MQQRPPDAEPPELGRLHPVEQVVARQDDHADRQHRLPRQPDEAGQGDHRPADRPDHLQEQEVEPPVPAETDHRQLHGHQPQAPGQQEARELAPGLAAGELQPGRDPGQEHEDRRAEVGDPAGGEEQRIAALRVKRIEDQRLVVEEVAHMVQHHEHHGHAAQQVDGRQALALEGGGRPDDRGIRGAAGVGIGPDPSQGRASINQGSARRSQLFAAP
ncbi:hypothetical protein LRS04_07860 [Phenylobacterium sp. J367]|nr:hypothetical protein [Phenylobacterium sp. J367]MCR5878280.1 hypothetical protein [Phenylobacterium sp. J367]